MATIDDIGGAEPLGSPPLGGPDGWAAAVRDALKALIASPPAAYTPVLGGGFTPGNGIGEGSYSVQGPSVEFRAKFTFGSASASAAGGITLTLPTSAVRLGIVQAHFKKASNNAIYFAYVSLPSPTTVGLHIPGTSGAMALAGTNGPWGSAWSTGDTMEVSGTYVTA